MPEKNNQQLVITRVFDAPRAAVWQAWTDPTKIMEWWGPKDFTTPVCQMDFRVGGKILSCMRGVAAPGAPKTDFWSTGIYKEIIPLEKIVYTDSFADKEGNVVPASFYNMPGEDWQLEMLVTVEFEDYPAADGKQTKMTLTHTGLPAGEMNDMTSVGWNQSFDKLADILQS